MASEINTKDQLAAMLSAKLNEFLDGVSDSYGKVILDELVARLEYTVTDFKDEVGEIMEQMLENAANKKDPIYISVLYFILFYILYLFKY